MKSTSVLDAIQYLEALVFKEKCPENVCNYGKEKFLQKYLSRLLFLTVRRSKPLFRLQKSTAIATEIDINEYLEKRIFSFIEKYHSDLESIFLPD